MVHNRSSLHPLSSKEKKLLLERLEYWYQTDLSELKHYFFYVNSKGKVHISTVDMSSVDSPRINSCGMYFGTIHDDERFRLSIEGSRLVKPQRNVVVLNEASLKSYISGENLFKDEVESINWEDHCPFLIVQFNSENLGSVSVKGDFLINYVSKGRKLDYNKLF